MLSTISCPKCGQYDFHRSRPRTIWELIKRNILQLKIYRCHNCDYREWVTIKEINPKVYKKGVFFYFYILAISIIIGLIIGVVMNH